MATLIFRLRNVPDDESDAIRSLLDKHAIDWYETTAGNWGIAMPGIWVVNEEQRTQALTLIGQYQQERTDEQRQIHAQQQLHGENMTFVNRVMEHPFRIAGIFVFCLFILYVSIHPFLQMIEFSRQ